MIRPHRLLPLALVLTLAPLGCDKSSADSAAPAAKAEPASLVPATVPFAQCPITIPADSEIADAKETSFTVVVKGGKPMFAPSILIVNAIVSVFSKTIDPGAENLKFTVEEQSPDGYALEGEFDKKGQKHYFVDRSIPCAPKAWLACRVVTTDKTEADYASRVCRTLVAPKK